MLQKIMIKEGIMVEMGSESRDADFFATVVSLPLRNSTRAYSISSAKTVNETAVGRYAEKSLLNCDTDIHKDKCYCQREDHAS